MFESTLISIGISFSSFFLSVNVGVIAKFPSHVCCMCCAHWSVCAQIVLPSGVYAPEKLVAVLNCFSVSGPMYLTPAPNVIGFPLFVSCIENGIATSWFPDFSAVVICSFVCLSISALSSSACPNHLKTKYSDIENITTDIIMMTIVLIAISIPRLFENIIFILARLV